MNLRCARTFSRRSQRLPHLRPPPRHHTAKVRHHPAHPVNASCASERSRPARAVVLGETRRVVDFGDDDRAASRYSFERRSSGGGGPHGGHHQVRSTPSHAGDRRYGTPPLARCSPLAHAVSPHPCQRRPNAPRRLLGLHFTAPGVPTETRPYFVTMPDSFLGASAPDPVCGELVEVIGGLEGGSVADFSVTYNAFVRPAATHPAQPRCSPNPLLLTRLSRRSRPPTPSRS